MCISLSNHGFHKRKGDSSGVTLLMWKFYWGTSKSEHFEWGMCGFFVIFNGVIFSYKIPVGWVIYLVGWKNGPFLEIFFTGVTSGVDSTGSQRRGCSYMFRTYKIDAERKNWSDNRRFDKICHEQHMPRFRNKTLTTYSQRIFLDVHSFDKSTLCVRTFASRNFHDFRESLPLKLMSLKILNRAVHRESLCSRKILQHFERIISLKS